MATVKLLKDYESDRGKFKAGAVISVPYMVAREMEAAGLVVHPVGSKPEPEAIPVDVKAARERDREMAAKDRELVALKKRIADLEGKARPELPAEPEKPGTGAKTK